MMAASDTVMVGIWAKGTYRCLPCAREEYGEIAVSRLEAGLTGALGPDAQVWAYEVNERLVEADEYERDGEEGDRWGAYCDVCGTPLVEGEQSEGETQ